MEDIKRKLAFLKYFYSWFYVLLGLVFLFKIQIVKRIINKKSISGGNKNFKYFHVQKNLIWLKFIYDSAQWAHIVKLRFDIRHLYAYKWKYRIQSFESMKCTRMRRWMSDLFKIQSIWRILISLFHQQMLYVKYPSTKSGTGIIFNYFESREMLSDNTKGSNSLTKRSTRHRVYN